MNGDAAALWAAYRSTRSKADRRALAEHYLPLVDKWARILKAGPLYFREFDELVADGTLGLMHALRHFRDGRGESFEAYADWCIRGLIYHGWRRMKRPRMPSIDAMRDARGDVGRFDVAGDDGRVDQAAAAAHMDLAAALALLDGRDRDVAEAYFLDGLDYLAIGERFGFSRARAGQVLAAIEERIGALLPFHVRDGASRRCQAPLKRVG